ncbi:GntR family transcriptional regulator [Streptosporangium carneum]|uniref:GntR family transcriptional regulator n=1 Tax=Streptosporangium carneum TaxID=47481 RepID=A0A9W6MFS9_9ACTN|nr:GntR family transcriptional regulator [Streptosporangium carneum]GLK12581.1 GntR family transcriptional regulator [Streptosporangium carneum]
MDWENPVTSARDVAYAYLRAGLVEGRLRPGEILDDATIAQEISVSRTPVREALIQLEREGMVTSPPRRRPKAAEARPDDLALIIAPLGVLQELAAQLAAPRATDDDVAAMRGHNDELLQAVQDGDIGRAHLADTAFHRVLVNRAGNRFLTSSIDSLETHTSRVVSLYFHNRGPDGQSAREHAEIIQAVLDRDASAAARATRGNYLRGLSLAGESA